MDLGPGPGFDDKIIQLLFHVRTKDKEFLLLAKLGESKKKRKRNITKRPHKTVWYVLVSSVARTQKS